MRHHTLLLLLMTLMASPAFAQYDEEAEEAPPLEGSGRFSLHVGWHYFPNAAFYDTYYFKLENRGLARAGGAIGGPLVTGTFAYSIYNWLELGIDLLGSYERMQLTQKPGLNTMTLGALVGVRLQYKLPIGPEGLVPSVGVLSGPMFAASYFEGGRSVENAAQAYGVVVGATLRLNKKWGACFDYRLIYALGEVEDVGKYQAGGNWFSVGVTYQFPTVPDRPLSRRF